MTPKKPRTHLPSQDSLPTPGQPNQAKAVRRAKVMRWTIYATLAMSVMATFAAMSKGTGAVVGTETTAAAPSVGFAQAAEAVSAWIDGRPAGVSGYVTASDRLDGMTLLGYAGFTSTTKATPVNATETVDVTLETHRFVVRDGAQVFELTIPVTVQGDLVWVMSNPSLEAVASPAKDVDSSWTWPGVEASPSTPAVDAAVKRWAAALAGTNAEALKAQLLDPEDARSYIPLGFELDEARAAMTGVVGQQVIARAELVIANADGSLAPLSFDVLLERADTATPNIVAWGTPGSGPTLTPYANAVTDDVTVSEAAASATVTTTTVAAATTTVPAATTTTAAPAASPFKVFVAPQRILDATVEANTPAAVSAGPGPDAVLAIVTFDAAPAGTAVNVRVGQGAAGTLNESPSAVLPGSGTVGSTQILIPLDANGSALIGTDAPGRLIVDVVATLG